MPRSQSKLEETSADGGQVLASMAALSDPTRLRLLRLLDQQELGVAELCDVLQLPQSTVSRHLKTLAATRDGGWLVARREGTARLYRLLLDELDPAKRDLWRLTRDQTEAWATAKQDELRLRQVLASRKSAGEFFEDVAGDWEQIRREQYGDRFDLAAAYAMLSPEMTVADLGCGTGHTIAELAPHVQSVVGVDASGPMLKTARRRLATLENVTLHNGQLDDLPIKDQSVDAAQCVLALSYIDDPAGVLGEMRRILRPGGRGVVVDVLAHDRDDFRRRMGQHHPGFAKTDVQRLLDEAGFEDARFAAMPPTGEATGPALFVASGTRSVGA